ncbi:hypothetical protein ACGFZK_09690 [Streptomyces sp. NPDC048257]|uniref:DoxX family protein n=1 Tax=Streptomyces sp. NPDC048257 TaxID=3365526 RepID=UPI003717547C
MEPFVVLIAVTGLLLLARALGAARPRRPAAALRGGLAAMFTLTGTAHFVGMREEIIAMVPSALPAPGLLVTLTGIAELACAVGLLWSRTALRSAAALSAMLVVMFPANVYAADGAASWWDRLGPRTAVQCVFLAATVTVVVRHRDRGTAPGRARPVHTGPLAPTCHAPDLSGAHAPSLPPTRTRERSDSDPPSGRP